jgi:hypothetical protein
MDEQAKAESASTDVPPELLFVAADEGLLLFPSIVTAEGCLEARDVRDGVYPAAYGPAGEVYLVETDGRRVIIVPREGERRSDEFKALLLERMEATGVPADPSEELPTLVRRYYDWEEAFWAEHDPYGDRLGTRIPLWGCLVVLSVVCLGFFTIWRLL